MTERDPRGNGLRAYNLRRGMEVAPQVYRALASMVAEHGAPNAWTITELASRAGTSPMWAGLALTAAPREGVTREMRGTPRRAWVIVASGADLRTDDDDPPAAQVERRPHPPAPSPAAEAELEPAAKRPWSFWDLLP